MYVSICVCLHTLNIHTFRAQSHSARTIVTTATRGRAHSGACALQSVSVSDEDTSGVIEDVKVAWGWGLQSLNKKAKTDEALGDLVIKTSDAFAMGLRCTKEMKQI